MRPTYSFSEIKSLIRSLDAVSTKILSELIEDERDCFTDCEWRALQRFIKLKQAGLVHNQVKCDYLLSFN